MKTGKSETRAKAKVLQPNGRRRSERGREGKWKGIGHGLQPSTSCGYSSDKDVGDDYYENVMENEMRSKNRTKRNETS